MTIKEDVDRIAREVGEFEGTLRQREMLSKSQFESGLRISEKNRLLLYKKLQDSGVVALFVELRDRGVVRLEENKPAVVEYYEESSLGGLREETVGVRICFDGEWTSGCNGENDTPKYVTKRIEAEVKKKAGLVINGVTISDREEMLETITIAVRESRRGGRRF